MSLNSIFDDETKDNRKYYFRDWLNPVEAGGTALIEVKVEHYEPGDNWPGEFDGNITLKDCSRQINLEFSFHSENQRIERLRKLDMLADQLAVLRRHMVEFELKPKKAKTKKKKKNG